MADSDALGKFLKERRMRLDPASLGISAGRRRTPGLRREEVAQRANISVTWYTWLEQGRGGAPSANVLERVASALLLTETEREHAFLLGLGRPPETHYRPIEHIPPRLQRVLDAMDSSAAFIRSITWDVLAWNKAATILLTDYGQLPASERNLLKQIFLNPMARKSQADWESVAYHMVSVFRADAARAGAIMAIQELVDELTSASPEFAVMWQSNAVDSAGEGIKNLLHPELGQLQLEYSSFSINSRPDLVMMVYTPVNQSNDQLIGT